MTMFRSINEAYRESRRAVEESKFILESVLDVEETIPGSEQEMDDITDVDSVPKDIYAALDKELDRIVSDPNYDDSEIEEMVGDEDFDEDEVSNDILTVVDEAADNWLAQLNEKIENTKSGEVENARALAEAVDRYRSALNGGSAVRNEHTANFGLDETTHDFQDFNGKKYHSEIGKPYEPVETPKDSKDETKPEGEALREGSYTDFGLNEDVEDKVEPEENKKEDCNEGCGDKDKKSCNEAVDRYRAVLSEDTQNEGAMAVGHVAVKTGAGALLGRGAGHLAGSAAATLRGEKNKAYRKLREDPNASSEDLAKARRAAEVEREQYKDKGRKIGTVAGAAKGAAEGVNNVKKGRKIMEELNLSDSVTNPDVEDFPKKAGEKKLDSGDDPTTRYRAVAEAAINGAPSAENEGVSTVNAIGNGVIGAGVGHLVGSVASKRGKANKEYQKLKMDPNATPEALAKAQRAAEGEKENYKSKGRAIGGLTGAGLSVAKDVNKSVSNEAVTNTSVEDFPGKEGTQTAEGNNSVPGMKHCDDSCIGGCGDESAFEEREVKVEDGGTDAIDVIKAKYQKAVSEAISNPSVEDFPGSTGTSTAEGTSYVSGMKHSDDHSIPSYTDQSDFEQKEVGVEDGGTDAIDVIKSKYQNSVSESASSSCSNGNQQGDDAKKKKKKMIAAALAALPVIATAAKVGVDQAKRKNKADKAKEEDNKSNLVDRIKDEINKEQQKGAQNESANPGKGESEGETTASSEVEDFPAISDKERGEDCPGRFPNKSYDNDVAKFKSSVEGAKGNDIGGDADVTDAEAKEVKVEDGGDDAIDVIKSKYQKVVDEACGGKTKKKICECGAAMVCNENGEYYCPTCTKK